MLEFAVAVCFERAWEKEKNSYSEELGLILYCWIGMGT